MKARTILLLAAKRSGTTAILRAFQRHPDVAICHADQTIENVEANVWNFAWRAVQGDERGWREHCWKILPFLEGIVPRAEEEIYAIWDKVLDELGPIVFDKSPKLTGAPDVLELIGRYRDRGNDVRFFVVVRDPRDVIASQFELWGHLVENDSPQNRERLWVQAQETIEAFQRRWGFPLYRYEDVARQPSEWMPRIFAHCGLEDCPEAYSHMKPVNVGRAKASRNEVLCAWTPGEQMREMMIKYGYDPERVGVDGLRESASVG